MKIFFTAAATDVAQDALHSMADRYGNTRIEDADVIVGLGGDGFLLEMLHKVLEYNIPIYGINYGTVGFLMNPSGKEDLLNRLSRAQPTVLHPLHMFARTMAGDIKEGLAFNDVFLFRQTRQTSRIRIEVDDKVRMKELVCDGIIVATPAGSTAYNLSAHGPIVPLGANILPLTPISAFRPRSWRGALLPSTATVRFILLDTDKRPTAAVADSMEIRDVSEVIVRQEQHKSATILFDPDHGLSERITAEQFS